MDSILQFIGTFASIFSIPLAIILYIRTSDARQNKTRMDIIRSLSCRIGEGKTLDRIEVSAVYNSKVREHNIRKPLFTETSILEDMISNVVSNPYLPSDNKTSIIKDLDKVVEAYNTEAKKQSCKNDLKSTTEHSRSLSKANDALKKQSAIHTFTAIAAILSTILAIFIGLIEQIDFEQSQEIFVPLEMLISLAVATIGIIVTLISYYYKKKK